MESLVDRFACSQTSSLPRLRRPRRCLLRRTTRSIIPKRILLLLRATSTPWLPRLLHQQSQSPSRPNRRARHHRSTLIHSVAPSYTNTMTNTTMISFPGCRASRSATHGGTAATTTTRSLPDAGRVKRWAVDGAGMSCRPGRKSRRRGLGKSVSDGAGSWVPDVRTLRPCHLLHGTRRIFLLPPHETRRRRRIPQLRHRYSFDIMRRRGRRPLRPE